LFIASELTDTKLGLKLRQETKFPAGDTTVYGCPPGGQI